MLSGNDAVFSDSAKHHLVEFMPCLIICTDINRGHLAAYHHVEKFVEKILRL